MGIFISHNVSRAVIDSMHDVFSVIDATDFRILDVNTHFLETYGLKKEDVIGKTCYEITHKRTVPCTPPDDICPLLGTLNTGKQYTTEHVHYRRDGKKQCIEVTTSPIKNENGKIVSVIHISRNITDRKRAEEALGKWANVFEHTKWGVVVSSADGKRMEMMNPAFAQMHGYMVEELIGNPCHDVFTLDAHAELPEHIRVAQEIGHHVFESMHIRKDGTTFPVLVDMTDVTDKDGTLLYRIVNVQDITERKRAEELHIENIRLDNESKAKPAFLAAMSHELRTPLNAIIGFSEIMSMGVGGNLNETHKGFVKDISNAGNHLLKIIGDILDLSKVDAGKMELVMDKFSVHELLEETLDLIKNKAIKHNIDLIKYIDPQLEFMEGDKQKIKQVLLNLLSNAVKFSKEDGGTISITLKKIDGMISFSVSDTGIGIEKKNFDILFKEFQQVDSGITRKYGGTGLGLVISKKFVELHGGKITMESIYGEGSTFTFSIPIQPRVN